MIQNLISNANEIIWSRFFLPGLLLCSLVLALRCDALQFKHFSLCMRGSIGSIFKNRAEQKGLSSFQAASTALASTVGTGNIVGTAQALCLGGAGAVFWMWAVSFLAMGVKYAEICLASHYQTKDKNGHPIGGPMYYIRAAFGKMGRPLAAAYALFAALAGLSMGNMTQINSAAASFISAVHSLGGSGRINEAALRLIFGLALAFLTLLIMSGGAKGVGRAASVLVPVMSLAFIVLSLILLCCHAQRLPEVLVYIMREAFTPRAPLGASGGMAASAAISWGLRRSTFSNEAGLGTAAIAHGLSEAQSPVKEGFWGVFEVFTDTTLLCTLTALVILCSGIGIPYGSSPGPELLSYAFSTVFGPLPSMLFVSATMLLLAFSSVLGWALYGVQCAGYILGERGANAYKWVFLALIAVGAVMSAELVWSLADFFNALMSVPNLLAVFILSGKVGSVTKSYLKKQIS